jgi:membrane protein DedA with SNARE-associated domain
MSGEHPPTVPRFRPLKLATPARLVVAAVISPLLWLAALVVAAYVLEETDAIELGLLIAAAAFVVALIVLPLLRAGRRREERRYAARR